MEFRGFSQNLYLSFFENFIDAFLEREATKGKIFRMHKKIL